MQQGMLLIFSLRKVYSVPGHEHVLEIVDYLRKGRLDVEHQHVPPEDRYSPFISVGGVSHDWHAHIITTELPPADDEFVRAAHYRINKDTGSPHVLALGTNAYIDVKQFLLRKYGENSKIYRYFKEHTRVQDIRGQRTYFVGLPHVVNGKIYAPVQYSHEPLPFDRPEDFVKFRPAELAKNLPAEYKHVLQGEHTIIGKDGPRYVGTNGLHPCVSVVVHDIKTGRTYVAHIDDGKFFSHWKDVVRHFESEAKGEYSVYVVGGSLHDPFVFNKPNSMERVGNVSKQLLDQFRRDVEELRKEGINIANVGFLHTDNFVFDGQAGTFHPLRSGTVFDNALKTIPERQEHIKEPFRLGERKQLHRV